jgi:hypothetical protein
METYRKVLTDVDENVNSEAFSLNGAMLSLGNKVPWSVRKFTLRGGLQEGVEVVEIDNGSFCFAVLLTRGMGIWRAHAGGVRLGWDSPVKDPVHPAYIHPLENGGIGWLKGFNEWMVRCGLSSMGAPGKDTIIDNNGNPSEVMLPLHGNIANAPARKATIEITEKEIILRGEVDETMLFGPALRLQVEIRTAFGANGLTLNDTVSNLGAKPAEHELLYHINYGEPLLAEGSRLVAPFKQVAPRDARAAEGIAAFAHYGAPEAGFIEQAYWFELAGKPRSRETAVMLRTADSSLGSVVRFSLKDFPCFTLWKNTAAKADGYVTGLEPSTSYPNTRAFERSKGRLLVLQGGESRRTSLEIELLATKTAVRAAERDIKALQRGLRPKVHPEPIARFSDV